MAENSRGQNRNGQNTDGRNRAANDQSKAHMGNDRQRSSNRDFGRDAGSSIGRRESRRGLRYMSSDYDGQLSDE